MDIIYKKRVSNNPIKLNLKKTSIVNRLFENLAVNTGNDGTITVIQNQPKEWKLITVTGNLLYPDNANWSTEMNKSIYHAPYGKYKLLFNTSNLLNNEMNKILELDAYNPHITWNIFYDVAYPNKDT